MFDGLSELMTNELIDATVDLHWEAPAASDLAGYRVSWQRLDEAEPTRFAVLSKRATSATLTVPCRRGVVYLFFVTAYDEAGNESAPHVLTQLLVAPCAPEKEE